MSAPKDKHHAQKRSPKARQHQTHTSKQRIQVYLDDVSWHRVKRLEKALSLMSDGDFFRFTLSFLKYLVTQDEKDAEIYLEKDGACEMLNIKLKAPRKDPATTKHRPGNGAGPSGRRFQVDLLRRALDDFDELMEKIGVSTRAAVFRHGLSLLDLVVEHFDKGGTLHMRREGRDYLLPLIGYTPVRHRG